ncbi:MAG: hypothetical protein JNL73_24165 [Anaerolineales bacterium]|nr:hypothetical protein [Anaerolineales bacterium]
MTRQVDRVSARVLAIAWDYNFDHIERKVTLAREFLRRLKLWERAVGVWPGYPFGDLGRHVAPTARADEALVARVRAEIATRARSEQAAEIAVAALHLAAAEDAGALAGFDLPRLFAPLLEIYELGGTFQTQKGFFEVDLGALRLSERDWAQEPALTVVGDDGDE